MNKQLKLARYGTIDLPAENLEAHLYPTSSKCLDNDQIEIAIANSELETFCSKYRTITVLINDATRPTPTNVILEKVCRYFDLQHTLFMIATGSHLPPSETQLRRILGENFDKMTVHIHDCYAKHEYIGTTKRNTRVMLDKKALEADAFVVIGSVEPHYFAGYTGGRKSFLPGIAHWDTIEQNHSLALDENSKLLALENNPVHLDMMEAISFLNKPVFSIQAVLNSNNQLADLTFGDIKDSFYEAVKIAAKTYTKPVHRKADIVVALIEEPYDQTLYQAHKGLENCKHILNKGGLLLLMASCKNGIGNDNFLKLLNRFDSYQTMESHIRENYKLGAHKALSLAKFKESHPIWLISQQKLKRSFADRQFDELQSALNNAIQQKGDNCRIIVLEHAASLVPILSI